MPIIHGREVNYGEIILFTPQEIIKSWHSMDGHYYTRDGCQYCSLHGKFRCDSCLWLGCSCNEECQYEEDWAGVMSQKRNAEHYKKLVKNLCEEGFTIPLNVIWIPGNAPKHGDGNHRFTAALELEFSVIPYLVTENFSSSRRGSDGWSDPREPLSTPITIDTPIPEELVYMQKVTV